METRFRIRAAVLASLALFLIVAPSRAVEIRRRDAVMVLARAISSANSPGELEAVLRKAAEGPAPYDTEPLKGAFGVAWIDNWAPRVMLWLDGVDAEQLFGSILRDEYLIEGVKFRGKIDLEIEARAGRPGIIRGRLKPRGASLEFRGADFAFDDIRGYVPFFRAVGDVAASAPTAHEVEKPNLTIGRLVWAEEPLATNLIATASYRDRVMRFDRIRMAMLGGKGLGTVVLDHRHPNWRMATMLRFDDVDLNRIHDILPGLPVLARISQGKIRGDIGLVYDAPDIVNVTGRLESTGPGVVHLAPRLYENVRGYLDQSVVKYRKLEIEIQPGENGIPEANITLYRETAETMLEMVRGRKISPFRVNLRIPLIPFVEETRRP